MLVQMSAMRDALAEEAQRINEEGAKAMTEYHANSRMIREKTERLKARRLAKAAAEKEQAS